MLTRKQKTWWAVITVLVLVYALFPVLSIFATSFKPPSELNLGNFWPEVWTGANYESILGSEGAAQGLFLSALRNSIGISLISTAIAVVLATLAAYAIARLDFPGKRFVLTTALIAFFIAWNDFVYGISLTSTDAARPVPAALAFFTGASQFEEPTGAISAAAIVVTIPVVILVLLFQRQIVSGLTQGAVKG